MSTGRIANRPATAADAALFWGRNPPVAIRAWVLDVDGEPAAIAGYFLNGTHAVMFSDIREGATIPKMTVWRESAALMERMTLPAICVATGSSGRFLKRLGWRWIGASAAGDVYEWNCS